MSLLFGLTFANSVAAELAFLFYFFRLNINFQHFTCFSGQTYGQTKSLLLLFLG